MKRSARFPLLLFLLASCGAEGTQILGGSTAAQAQKAIEPLEKVHLVMDASETVTPFTYAAHRVFAPVSVNGGRDATFLVVYCSLATFIDEDMVKELGLKVEKKAVEGRADETVELVRLESLSMGGATLEGLPVWPQPLKNSKFQGVLGLDFLGAMETTIDYTARKIIQRFPEEATLKEADRVHVHTYDTTEDAGPTLKVTVGEGITLNVLLNTSNPHFMHLNEDDAASLGIDPNATLYDVSESPAGPTRHKVVKVPDLQIGRVKVSNVYAHLTDKPSELGNKVLEHFRITANLSKGLVSLVPGKGDQVTLEPEFGTGATLTITDDQRVVVIAVTPDSPAKEAGLAIRDQVVEVAGKSLGKNPLDQLKEIPKAPGSMNAFKVKRGDEVLEFRIPRNLMM